MKIPCRCTLRHMPYSGTCPYSATEEDLLCDDCRDILDSLSTAEKAILNSRWSESA
jgi:hypothetical protein